MDDRRGGPRSLALWIVLGACGICPAAAGMVHSSERDCLEALYFRVKVIDSQTGRGVPLVVLRTTNNLSFVTDSQGVAAIYEPGLMNTKVFFTISSHGYEFPADGFGFHGKAVQLTPGGSVKLKVKRLNIAERLYRVTGQGIYRDSIIVGEPVPTAEPVINGLVMGQDSVQTCIYHGRLYWFWGDTARPSYPLGNFATSGAVSDLPGRGGLDPAVGVNLRYFVDKDGFSKKMAPVSEPGMIWLDGIFAVTDSAGNQRMFARYARMKSLAEAAERGIMLFNDRKHQFEPVVRCGADLPPYNASGHAFAVTCGPDNFYYFATPFPLAARMRVRALYDHARDPNRYEVFTALALSPQRGPNDPGNAPRWIPTGKLLEQWDSSKLVRELTKEKQAQAALYDIETGRTVIPHGGSIYWNEYRRKWVMVTVQTGGDPSFLGEAWYAEADTPLGPWGYARKIVTHDRYSFYNPKQHPYFDQAGGRLIYFEGTYSHTFSGDPADATPRYDYNQVMYRLDLADKRLCLPEPVYEIAGDGEGTQYLLGRDLRRAGKTGLVSGIPFYAVAPERASEGLVPLYAVATSNGRLRLSAGAPAGPGRPVFFALPASKPQGKTVVPLFEYTNKQTAERRYAVADLPGPSWTRAQSPMCCVWKNPAKAVLADWQALPRTE